MKKLLLAVATICLSFTTGTDNEYCNTRFRYCEQYPAGFTGQGESANGDGQTFLSADKEARMAAWSVTIHYPPSQQAKYKDYCAYIAKSLQ